jgi:Ca2+-transporting ATPase
MNYQANQDLWHSIGPEQLFKDVASGDAGLDDSEIPHRIERFGPNTLEAKERPSIAAMAAGQLHHPLIYLLLGAAAVSAISGHLVDAGVILGVVVLNTILGTIQELKAQRAMESLHQLAAPHARVLREGRDSVVPAQEVVPGDMLLLDTGSRVPADARVIESVELHADESALTGESEAVAKITSVLEPSTPLADRRNMVWMSSAITAGRGKAVVVATGMNTALGKIAGQVHEAQGDITPLQKRLNKLAGILGVAGIILALVVFGLGLLRGFELVEMILFAIAVAVSAIPEGLPAVISVTLALGVQRMARRNSIIRNLPAVETLGSTTVICSDKTGTITRNEMTVTRVWTADGGEQSIESLSASSNDDSATGALARIGAQCNNAAVVTHEGTQSVRGTATDGAILVASRKMNARADQLAAESPRLAEIPFSSQYKYMATLNGQGEQAVAMVKGAPDRLMGFCTHVMHNNRREPLDERWRRAIEEANQGLADQALRVVAAARKEMPGARSLSSADVEEGLTFVGLWGLVDPPRPEAISAIGDAKEAGVRVIMITGDHAATALAIAREVGIASPDAQPLTGAQLDKMDDEELASVVERVSVYARVSPEHKLRVLKALKSHDHTVAMTGDGVNDAPALKGADIGVAMGRSGTEVAKEAADMILTDDNFATIVHAVEEGRVIFSNLRRVVFFLITTNLGEVITLAAALLIGLPLPLTATMILWINLVTDGVCTVPLGMEPKHWDVLKQPPRPPGSGVLNKQMLRRMLMLAPLMAAGTLGLFAYELKAGSHEHAQSVAFATLAAFQWFHAFNARTTSVSAFSVGVFSNMWLWGGILLAVVLQVLAVNSIVGQALFGTQSLTLFDWLLITAVSSSILVVDEVLKALGVHGKPRSSRAL